MKKLPHSVPKGPLGLVQGLPLGRKLSQFLGRDPLGTCDKPQRGREN
jgi:hypothetical protein